MYIISSGESATLADYFPCISHDLSWSNVRCMTVWWGLFSIEAMICIGSGWSSIGWPTNQNQPSNRWRLWRTCHGPHLGSFGFNGGWVDPFQDSDWPSLNCQLPLHSISKGANIIKNHQIPGSQRAPDRQAAVAVLSVWPAAPRFVEAGSRSMKQSKFDPTTWIWFN